MVEVEHGPLCLSENWKLHLTLSAPPPAVGFIFRYSRTNTASNTIHQIGRFLFEKLKYSILHAPMVFSLLHMFHNCFCFRSTNTTFPSHMGTFGQRVIVLHCNYNRDVAPKFNLLIWLGVLLTQGQHVWAAFCMIFSGVPHSTIFGLPKYARQILCLSYLAVFDVFSAHIWANRTHQSKVITKSNFGETSP